MKGKFLNVEEVSNLIPSEKKYYVMYGGYLKENNKNEVYKLRRDYFTNEAGNNSFNQGCIGVKNGDIKVYEYLEDLIKNERRNNIMKNAVVKFQGTSKHYHFITDLDLQEGDTVVCDTAVGITVAAVIRIEEEVSSLATKWIIDKVDIDTHKRRMELEAKKKDIKAKMEKRRKKLEDIAVFAILAKEDSDMAELLKEYQEINN